jgi:hypothetical protein
MEGMGKNSMGYLVEMVDKNPGILDLLQSTMLAPASEIVCLLHPPSPSYIK